MTFHTKFTDSYNKYSIKHCITTLHVKLDSDGIIYIIPCVSLVNIDFVLDL